MKRPKKETKSAGKKSKPASRKKGPQKQVDLAAVRQKIANKVGGKAVRMVDTAIKEVGKGHYPAMKYLFEMIGLYPQTSGDGPVGDDVLAKTLLQRLSLPESAVPPDSGELGAESAAEEAATDAVE